MSDAATACGVANDSGADGAAALTAEAIEAVLDDFRAWLHDLAKDERPPVDSERGESVDLFALVGQFTALRHEVNMQTRAARAAVEQNTEALKLLAAIEPADPDEELRPIAKALIDITDALSLSWRQMEKFRDTAEPLLDEIEEPSPSPTPGFFGRLFGSRSNAVEPATNPALDKLRQLAAAAADGYAMSLRRMERILPTMELEPQACVGEPFDPDTMEAVEVVGDSGEPAGTVIEEVRPGYLWRGKVIRFAQVKVAR